MKNLETDILNKSAIQTEHRKLNFEFHFYPKYKPYYRLIRFKHTTRNMR